MSRKTELQRSLTWWDACNVVLGIVIGAGIFVTPQDLAKAMPSFQGMILAWFASGIFVFCGALAFAELATTFPATGGLYVYLRESFGPRLAFSSGWIHLFALLSGATAYIAAGFGRYLSAFVPMEDSVQRGVAIFLILGLSILNCLSTRATVLIQNLANGAKVLALLVLILGAWFHPGGSSTAVEGSPFEWGGAAMALAVCFFCYEGWSYAGFVAGELKDPARNLPRAFAISFATVVLLYLLLNLAYLRVFSIAEIQSNAQIGTELATRILGPIGGVFVTVIILLAIVGSVNGVALAASRLYFAQSQDGLFLPTLDRLHPTWNTPVRSICLHCCVSCCMFLVPNLGNVLQLAIFSAWLYYFFAVVGLIRLRLQRPELERPYRMWGYPLTPILFLLGSGFFLVSLVLSNPVPPAIVFVLLLISIPAASKLMAIRRKLESARPATPLA